MSATINCIDKATEISKQFYTNESWWNGIVHFYPLMVDNCLVFATSVLFTLTLHNDDKEQRNFEMMQCLTTFSERLHHHVLQREGIQQDTV